MASILDVSAQKVAAAQSLLIAARGRFLQLSGSDADSQTERVLVDELERATHAAEELRGSIRGCAGIAHELEVARG